MDKPKKPRKVQKTINGKTTTVTLKPSSIKEALQYGGAKRKIKFDDGGSKVTRADIREAKRLAKLKRIEAGIEPSTYDKVPNITGNVAKTAAAVAESASAVRDARSAKSGPGMQQKGGAVTYKTGGMVNSNAKVTASKVSKGRPAKSAEPKGASKVTKGRVGGTSKAPKTAKPRR